MKQIVPYNHYLLKYAVENRKKLTYTERIMWNLLKGKQFMGYDFHRQKPVLTYIVDFFCYDLMLAIEVDGLSHTNDGKEAFDRQANIEALGISFLRFDGYDVLKSTENVIRVLESWILEFEEKNGIPEKVKVKRGLG
jgi:very-short-patch-repair endonuclease